MSSGQTTNKPLTTTRSTENTEEPRTTQKGKEIILSFCLTFNKVLCTLKKECISSLLYLSKSTEWQSKKLRVYLKVVLNVYPLKSKCKFTRHVNGPLQRLNI